MAEVITPKTLDERLTDYTPATYHGWADDGAGSIDVELSQTAGREEIIGLHEIANTSGYSLTFEGEDHDGATHWRFAVELTE